VDRSSVCLAHKPAELRARCSKTAYPSSSFLLILLALRLQHLLVFSHAQPFFFGGGAVKDRWLLASCAPIQRAPMAPQQPLRSLRLGAPAPAPAPATGHAACRCSAAAPLFGKRLPLVVAVAHCSAVQRESSASTAGTYSRLLLVATTFLSSPYKEWELENLLMLIDSEFSSVLFVLLFF
jgi:hypothetical protein